MILIIGSNLDDIAYIQTKMTIQDTEEIFHKYPVYIGMYGGKKIVLATSGYGQEVSCLVSGLLIEKYHPYVVIHVGAVHSISPSLVQGDLFLASRIYAMDVDLMGLGKYKYGEIPELPPFFISDSDLTARIRTLNGLHKNRKIVQGVLLSGNRFHTELKEVEAIVHEHFEKVNSIYAIDTESSGVASACALFDIPYLCFKTCSYELQDKKQLITRVRSAVSNALVIGQLLTLLFKDLT